jgi:uncharacterized protein (TIGR03066 family)
MRATLLVTAILLGLPLSLTADAPEARTPSVGAVRGDSLKDLIVGKWEPKQMNGAVVEFKRNGTLVVTAAQFNMEGTYKFLKNDQVELNLAIGGADQKVKLRIKVTKGELIATELDRNTTESFKRIK